MALPNCPKCSSEYTYENDQMYVCPECGYEWSMYASAPSEEVAEVLEVRDANGNLLSDGDTVSVIKDLKVKGSSSVLKMGTKVKNIRLVEGDHNIDCKIEGFGAMNLKSEYVKKIQKIWKVHGPSIKDSMDHALYKLRKEETKLKMVSDTTFNQKYENFVLD